MTSCVHIGIHPTLGWSMVNEKKEPAVEEKAESVEHDVEEPVDNGTEEPGGNDKGEPTETAPFSEEYIEVRMKAISQVDKYVARLECFIDTQPGLAFSEELVEFVSLVSKQIARVYTTDCDEHIPYLPTAHSLRAGLAVVFNYLNVTFDRFTGRDPGYRQSLYFDEEATPFHRAAKYIPEDTRIKTVSILIMARKRYLLNPAYYDSPMDVHDMRSRGLLEQMDRYIAKLEEAGLLEEWVGDEKCQRENNYPWFDFER